MIATSTAFGDLPPLVEGIRSLGSETPIIGSWACDGTYWNPEGLSNFLPGDRCVGVRRRPNPDLQGIGGRPVRAGPRH